MIKNENTRISVTLPRELHEKLLNEAEYEGRSVSNLVLKIIKSYYKFNSDDE